MSTSGSDWVTGSIAAHYALLQGLLPPTATVVSFTGTPSHSVARNIYTAIERITKLEKVIVLINVADRGGAENNAHGGAIDIMPQMYRDKKTQKWLRLLTRIISAAVVGYLAITAVILLLLPSLMHMPDTREPTATQLDLEGLRFWPAAQDYRGYIGSSAPANPKATVVVLHGNAGAGWQRSYYVEALQARGYRVILAEYPGYAGRAGKTDEQSLVDDARHTVQAAYAQFGAPIIVWGESLGCGVAASVAARASVPLHAVVMLTPWDTLANTAQAMLPYLPVRFWLRGRYDNVANLRQFDGPVAVLVASEDEVVPPRLGKHLFQSLGEPKKLWLWDAAGHNNWPAASDAVWWDEVLAFVNPQATGLSHRVLDKSDQ